LRLGDDIFAVSQTAINSRREDGRIVDLTNGNLSKTIGWRYYHGTAGGQLRRIQIAIRLMDAGLVFLPVINILLTDQHIRFERTILTRTSTTQIIEDPAETCVRFPAGLSMALSRAGERIATSILDTQNRVSRLRNDRRRTP